MSREDSMVFSGQNAGVGVFVGKDSFNPDGQNAGRHRLALASLVWDAMAGLHGLLN